MTVLEMIKTLQKEGFEVKFRKRKDGSYLIKEINGRKFTGAKGNAEARAILGVSMSKARTEQLQYNINKYIKGKRKPKVKLPEDLKKETRDIQKLFRKVKANGKISMPKIRHIYAEGGRRAVIEYMSKMRRYASGYAYYENVEYLAARVESLAKMCKWGMIRKQLFTFANYIREIIETFREEWIHKCYEICYEIEHAITFGDKEYCQILTNQLFTIVG